MENGNKKELKQFVYSIRLTKREKQLLKKNKHIKKELDEILKNYLKTYLD